MAPDYILVEGQQFSKAKLSLDNHVYKNCAIDDCDIYFSGGQYELLDIPWNTTGVLNIIGTTAGWVLLELPLIVVVAYILWRKRQDAY